ncbi:hypothetical protein BJV82DRAFT_307935 [Fennellomyces sp. T-0311]|nr:hypothetical protein BJV82DRAFT_307935 [Fennellomyces sp. T-0311]
MAIPTFFGCWAPTRTGRVTHRPKFQSVFTLPAHADYATSFLTIQRIDSSHSHETSVLPGSMEIDIPFHSIKLVLEPRRHFLTTPALRRSCQTASLFGRLPLRIQHGVQFRSKSKWAASSAESSEEKVGTGAKGTRTTTPERRTNGKVVEPENSEKTVVVENKETSDYPLPISRLY